MRDRHVYILGKPGMGKSTLMLNMIRQDIEAGKAVGLIDPAGDLAESVLRYIPEHRIKDTIYFNPAETPIGIDFISAQTDAQKDLVEDDLYIIYQRLSGSGGVRMDMIAKWAIKLLVHTPGSTFHDLYRLFVDDYFLHQMVQRVKDEPTAKFWREAWPKFPHPATEEPLVTRMAKFDSQRALRTITGTVSPLTFNDVLAGKIFIANIAKGQLGSDTSSILGTLLVSQFQLAAFKRANLPQHERKPFYLYIDEFQNFKTSTFNEIIIEARKYQLCLTLANQKLKDLDEEMRGAVEAVETMIFFRLTDDDARRFGSNLGKFTARDLLDLYPYHAIIRAGRVEDTTRFEVEPPPPPPKGFRSEIVAHTRATYPSVERNAVTDDHSRQTAIDESEDDDASAGPPPD